MNITRIGINVSIRGGSLQVLYGVQLWQGRIMLNIKVGEIKFSELLVEHTPYLAFQFLCLKR